MDVSHLPPPDDRTREEAAIARLNYAGPTTPVQRAKNFRLAGTGFNPILIYASALGFVLVWLFGAMALSIFGPAFAVLLTLAVCGTAVFYSFRQSRWDGRISAGLCPQCGYDLRASNDRCPECGYPVPEPILRWRRLRPPPEPGMPGYIPPVAPRGTGVPPV